MKQDNRINGLWDWFRHWTDVLFGPIERGKYRGW